MSTVYNGDMADIASSAVFTNGVVSCGTSDLLRQAFQEVVDDDDRENEFVAFLHGDGDDSQTIHLTHAQASALRLTFEVDSTDEPPDNITYRQDQNSILDDITAPGLEPDELSPRDNDSMETINFPSESVKSVVNGIVKVDCPQLRDWTSGEGHAEEALSEETIAMKSLEMSNTEEQANGSLLDRFSDDAETRKIYVPTSVQVNDIERINLRENNLCFVSEESSRRVLSQNNVRDSQARILQRLPVILPSSQFVIKPTQTLLKSTKNFRILPNTNKIANTNVGALSGAAAQNSILLPKGASVNTLSPQLIKATPIATQLLNSGALSAQLLNTSQILAGATTCDFQNQNGNVSTNGSIRGTQNIVNTPIRLSPMVKTASGIIQRSNSQQFIMPTLKASQDGGGVAKSPQISNGTSVKTAVASQYLKSVQIPAQMLRNAGSALAKNATIAGSTTKIAGSTNSPIIFRTTSVLKAQDVKTSTTASTIVSSVLRTSSQNSSTPISILKPQMKTTFNCASDRHSVNSSNVLPSVKNNVATPRFVQKTATSQPQNETNERSKVAQNGVKNKTNEATLATARVVKRAKVAGLHNPVALTAEQTDTSKPLGSSENPIQIVQQGHTFHSMQRLTQSQLKQIAHVLQQRSQEAAMPNEKIVYRVVFPEELDLRMRNPSNLLKARGGKRGRPKKTAVRPPAPTPKAPTPVDEELEEMKDDRKKVVARTRSGRLSRPPRHMVRDYKHLHHMDFTQPDLDDSDGGYSDYNTNAEKLENDDSTKELLSGLEVPKRKISDHFRCPTCNKIYLGRTRMARHFEMHPDHGSPEQLPPPTPDPELKRAIPQDPLKRKGKKRGPWAYVTPEAKSERRQVKLKEAISVCENSEIINIAAKPVLNAQSLFDLLVLKSDNNVRTFLNELQGLMKKIREQVGSMLSSTVDGNNDNGDVVNLNEESLCGALGLDPGLYNINNEAFRKTKESFTSEVMNTSIDEEPPLKLQKTHIVEECKDLLEERMSSGFSESSDMSVSDFLHERKNDVMVTPNCPEVLTALTLMPRNPSPMCPTEVTKSNGMSLLISNPEIQIQISENPGFQKIDINSSKTQPSYRKIEALKDGFTKLSDSLELTNCSTIFTKLDANYDEPKTLQQAFIKLEPMEQGFKLENSTVSSFQKENSQTNSYDGMETGSQSFVKGVHKLISKIIPVGELGGMSIKTEPSTMDPSGVKILRGNSKISDSLPMLQDQVPIMSGSCDASIFGSTDNLDMSKITSYDHIPHLDILTTSGVMDKHLMMDEKLVEQLHLVDQSNLVDELVSERLKNIMPDNILENNLIANNTNLDTDLDFEALSEEFNRNTRS